MNKIDYRNIERNVYRDYFKDGLSDMLLGGYFWILGALLIAGSSVVFGVLAVIFYMPLLKTLKQRFTYPRTGYVELREGDPQPLPWFILGSLLLGLVVLVIVLYVVGALTHPDQWYRWIPIFIGIWFAGIFLGLALRVGLLRYYVVAGLALIAGISTALLPATGKLESLGRFFYAMGAVVFVWGLIIFIWFLLKHPIQTQGGMDVTG